MCIMGRLSAFLLLGLLVGCVQISAETFFANPQCARNCCHNDQDFVLFKTRPDCTIIHKATDTEILAHQAVLAASIPFFNDTFFNQPSEMARVELNPDLDLSAVQCLVNFAYKQIVRIHSRNVEGLLRTARFLRVTNVVDACTTFLTKRFTPANVIGTLNMANLSQFTALRSQAEEYARRHFYKLSQTQSILDLNAGAFVNLLDSNDLNLSSEEPVFEVAIRWLEYKAEIRSQMKWDVLKHVRYPMLSINYLTTRVQTESLVRSSSSVQQLIDEAIQYSSKPKTNLDLDGCRTWPRNGTAQFIVLGTNVSLLQVIKPLDQRNQRKIIISNPSKKIGAAVHQCRIYTFGVDARDKSTVYQFNPQRNTWALFHQMKVNLQFSACATMNHRIYVSGGSSGQSTLDTVGCYDPETRTWSMVAPMLVPRVGHALIVFEDSLYALGGWRDDYENGLKSVERFDAIRNEWTFETSMLVARAEMGVAELNGKLYACGGYQTHAGLSSAEVFDPVQRTWKQITPMSVGRFMFSLLAHKDRLYAVGGLSKLTGLSSVDVYDPKTNSWKLMEDYLDNPGSIIIISKNLPTIFHFIH